MEAFKAKNKSMLRVVDEASDVSWGSRGNRESHPLVVMMVALKSFFQAMCSEGRDGFWCCYRRVRCLYKCWLESKRPTYHISAVSGVLGKAVMKVREETKAPHEQPAVREPLFAASSTSKRVIQVEPGVQFVFV